MISSALRLYQVSNKIQWTERSLVYHSNQSGTVSDT